MDVCVYGGGVAASCCIRLLRRAAVAVTQVTADRPRVPAVMLSETTQKLLGDVFESADLFAGMHRIVRRVVQWGDAAAVALPHSSVVASEEALLDRLQAELPAIPDAKGPAQWTIVASRTKANRGAGPTDENHFGSRVASATAVALQSEAVSESCWIESQTEGWLFLLPCDRRTGWLLAVGGEVPAMLERSRLVAPRIAGLLESGGSFPTHPRIADPLVEPAWLACGNAALAFDPLCGDGAGHATREAILATAVVRASMGGEDANLVAEHYWASLTGGFRRHLGLCRQFYGSGGTGTWWSRQIEDLDRGLEWTGERLGRQPEFHYRLNGFNLEPLPQTIYG